MNDSVILDALSMMTAASKDIDQALQAALDHSGRLDPVLLDIELVERHRYWFRIGLGSFEESLRPADYPTDELE